MRLSCVIINLIYRIHLEPSMWSDLRKDSFLNIGQNRAYLFFRPTQNLHLNAIASMLFDASNCSMFHFQCSIYDSVIFILLFCMLNLP